MQKPAKILLSSQFFFCNIFDLHSAFISLDILAFFSNGRNEHRFFNISPKISSSRYMQRKLNENSFSFSLFSSFLCGKSFLQVGNKLQHDISF